MTQGTAMMTLPVKREPNWGAFPGLLKRKELVHGTEGGRDIQADSEQSLSTLIMCFQLFFL